MIKKLIIAVLTFWAVVACSSIDDSLAISNIEITAQGSAQPTRPEMSEICQGFAMSEKKLEAFYNHAVVSKTAYKDGMFKRLPCFTQGVAYFYGDKMTWRVYAGGLAEFYNEKQRIVKVCGIKCCQSVQGVC